MARKGEKGAKRKIESSTFGSSVMHFHAFAMISSSRGVNSLLPFSDLSAMFLKTC